MKGILLAGGMGTRLHPLTKITNKHLIAVYDKPMILYPLELLTKAGIKAVCYVSPDSAHDFTSWKRSLYYFAPMLFQAQPNP